MNLDTPMQFQRLRPASSDEAQFVRESDCLPPDMSPQHPDRLRSVRTGAYGDAGCEGPAMIELQAESRLERIGH